MELKHLAIHNFRGILDQKMDVDDYTLLVGANNAGKSTVIDCIRAFYEKDGAKYSKGDVPFTGASDKSSWIELTFDLTDDEHSMLAKEYRTTDKQLRVRKLFAAGENESRKAGFIYGYETDGNLANQSFYGAKNVQSGKFGRIVYIPAISKVDEHAKLTGPSALRDLLYGIMSSVARDGAAYDDFTASVNKFSETVRDEKTADGRSLEGLESAMNEMLELWHSEFRLKFDAPEVNDLIRHMVAWQFVDADHGESLDVDQYGSGFQRYFIYALLRLASRYVGTPHRTKTTDFTPEMTLLLFEEPEAFLHPPLQEALARSLDEIASDGRWQIICSTHSSHFAARSTNHIPSIVRLSQREGRMTARQITQRDWQALVEDNQHVNQELKDIHPDDRDEVMESIKYFLWLNPDRAGVFFANHVVLVEGATELALIDRLIRSGEIRHNTAGIHILDCLGKYNIHRFMNLLGRLEIPHSVIHDNDEHNKNSLSYKFNDVIERSRNASTVEIALIEGDLEKMLGLTGDDAPKSDHRKPQHVLYRYQADRIDADRLRQFCQLVESCLPDSDTTLA